MLGLAKLNAIGKVFLEETTTVRSIWPSDNTNWQDVPKETYHRFMFARVPCPYSALGLAIAAHRRYLRGKTVILACKPEPGLLRPGTRQHRRRSDGRLKVTILATIRTTRFGPQNK